MKEIDIQAIIDKNYTFLILLGYSMGLLHNLKEYIPHPLADDDQKKFDWFHEALTNVVYLNKPMPPMPPMP